LNSEKELKEILIECLNGNHDAFRCLVETYQTYGYSVAMRYLNDLSEVEDVVQETFISVWKNLSSFNMEENFRNWFYRIIINKCLDNLRIRKRKYQLMKALNMMRSVSTNNNQNLNEKNTNTQDTFSILYNKVSSLPKKQRTVFILRDLEELSMRDVSEITGLSIGSVKSNLYYARKNIQNELLPYYKNKELE